jgi:DNA mismatch repair ATPase MutS
MIDEPSRELDLIKQVIGHLEDESFESGLLNQLQRELRSEPYAGSVAIAKLHRIVMWMEAQRNQMFAPVAFLLVLPVQFAYLLEDWRELHGPNIAQWLDALGELEALVALSSYAYEHPADPFPEFVEEERLFAGEALGHPLIPEADCVRNDVQLDANTRLYIVSGSNMSGKSTYLRAVGINAVLAQAGAPVRAKRLRMSPFNLGATLRIQDSIHLGRSRFYAEIARLGELARMGTPERPLLFLLDELLHGTNSHDRAVGGEAVLKQFLDAGAMGLVTTHDVALTAIEGEFGGRATNVHFRDEVVEGELRFDHKLHPGPIKKGNALALMRAVGLQV